MEQKLFFTAIAVLICLGMYLCFVVKSFKVLEETKDRLIFQIKPTFSWSISIFFGGLTLIALIFTLISPPLTILNCIYLTPEKSLDRHYPSCQLIKSSWLGLEQNKTSIIELKEAIMEAKLDTNKNSNLFDRYRIILITDRGSLPLTETYTYSLQPEYHYLLTSVNQINSFIANPLQSYLLIERNEKILGYTGFAIISFFGLITFIILAMAPYINCFLDRNLDLLTIERCNLFKKTISTYKISNIITVKVEEQSDLESSTYRLTIFLRSGEKIPFTYFSTSGWKEKEEMSHRLQNFLKIKNLR